MLKYVATEVENTTLQGDEKTLSLTTSFCKAIKDMAISKEGTSKIVLCIGEPEADQCNESLGNTWDISS